MTWRFLNQPDDLHDARLHSFIGLTEDPPAPYLRSRKTGDGGRSDLGSARRTQTPGAVRAMHQDLRP
jgi:hypothetical protein